MLPKKNNPDSSSDCPVSNKFNSILTNNPVARLDEPFRGFKMVVARVLYQQLGGTIFYFYIFLKVVLRFFFFFDLSHFPVSLWRKICRVLLSKFARYITNIR